MLNCAEQVQIQKYKAHVYKTLKTASVQTIMLKHPTKQYIKKNNYPTVIPTTDQPVLALTLERLAG